MIELRANYLAGQRAYSAKLIKSLSFKRQIAILNDKVYDLTSYAQGGRRLLGPNNVEQPGANTDFMHHCFRTDVGTDITKKFDGLGLYDDVKEKQEICLRNLFYKGVVDHRSSPLNAYSRDTFFLYSLDSWWQLSYSSFWLLYNSELSVSRKNTTSLSSARFHVIPKERIH